jgi:hypothetical protein
MKKDAKERGIKVKDNDIALLVLADVMDDVGLAIQESLEDVDKTLLQGLPDTD